MLRTRGADHIAHPGGTLLEHLQRVRGLLRDWGASAGVQLAGFCHACYGTAGFEVTLLDLAERPRLVEVIGAEAEAAVYLYGSCDRAYVYPQLGHPAVEFQDRFTEVSTTPGQRSLRAFVQITAANEWDVVPHNAAIAAEHGEALRQLFHQGRRVAFAVGPPGLDRARPQHLLARRSRS